MQPSLTLPPARRITLWLCAAVAALIALSTAGQVSKYFLGHPRLMGFVPAFYVDEEANVPAWYSSFALALAAGLLGAIAAAMLRRRRPYRFHWAALAGLFALLSVDEIAMLHEYPIDPLREALGAGGALYYTWVIPGMALVLVVGAAYVPFLLHLPRRTMLLIATAAAVFVGGAIGVEMLSGIAADPWGEEHFTYALVITLEECCEMLGVVIFIHALVEHIHRELGGLHLQIGAARAGSA